MLGSLIAKAFADGDRDVFADIGRAHTTFLATVGAASRSGDDLAEAWDRCERELRKRLFNPPGDPGGGTEDEFWVSLNDPRLRPGGPHHNELLVLGFRAYYRAMEAATDDQRSQRMLVGNCLLALHEQKLLSLAISVGFRSWLRTITTPWASLETRYHWRHREPGSFRLWLEHRWIRFATRHLTGVELPIGVVKTGRSVPAGERPIAVDPLPTGDGGSGRRRIDELSDEVLLGKLFGHFSVDGRRARCWNDLGDRMAFIMALFARHQRSRWWFDEAGTVVRPQPWADLGAALEEQLAAMAPPPEPDETDGSGGCHLSDAELDALRSQPTHLALADADQLALETVADEANAERARAIRKDVAERLRRAAEPGGLLDPSTCSTARRAFTRWSTVWFMALVFRSLPDSYAAAAGVHVLGRVSDLATDPFRRAGETAFFVIDLLDSEQGWRNGEMEADGAALRSVQGVRVMHALAAHRLLAHSWPSDDFGLPFNQEDVIGAALGFGVSPIEMLDGLGIDIGDETRNAVVRFWLGIGFLLGAPHDALTVPGRHGRRPLDYRQARDLAIAIRRRHHARSLDGVRLSEALQEGVADGFPRWFGWLAPGLTGALGDDRVSALLMVGNGDARRTAALVTKLIGGLLRVRPLRPISRAMIQAVGRRWIRPFLAQGRTRPYRRPLTADDVARLEAEARLPDLWPAGCRVADLPQDDQVERR